MKILTSYSRDHITPSLILPQQKWFSYLNQTTFLGYGLGANRIPCYYKLVPKRKIPTCIIALHTYEVYSFLRSVKL